MSDCNDRNGLGRKCGNISPLKRNGYFERFPHRRGSNGEGHAGWIVSPYATPPPIASTTLLGVFHMRRSPSIVPRAASRDTYLVLDDFGGPLGRAWRGTEEKDTDRETLIRDLMEGHYRHPTRIVAFNTAEGWSRDVTLDIAASYAGALRSTTRCHRIPSGHGLLLQVVSILCRGQGSSRRCIRPLRTAKRRQLRSPPKAGALLLIFRRASEARNDRDSFASVRVPQFSAAREGPGSKRARNPLRA